MMKKLALATLFLALGSMTALAADFSGKWTADVQGRNGTQTITFNFKVDGSTLTGTVTTPRGDTDISNGKVDGDNISFDQVMNFNGNSITLSYKGTADGDTIKFTRTFGGGDRPPQEFVAKRATDAAPAPAAPAAPPAAPPQ
ncbi:conserved exported hypothetical protein [Candidatus Sulfotelmatomonas gaucii]|uniref:Uncharacterized protein n=1 Tax=Candidatus Sulfuritelmatomonas gaucii TaxID=2043161 RepID=A0A2N9L4U8_9BACT|nr:conserved exported hypothetical protein [Candidatus Sulfotelmatomonas gaucii]